MAGDAPTRRFLDRVDAYRREVERRRFAGDSPLVRPAARGRRAFEAAAAAVAAERLHGLVELEGEALSPTEDLAADELSEGLRSLANLSFGLASRHLAAAADLARLPRLQQQVSLARALDRLCRDVLYTEPGARWGGADLSVLALVPTLDLISPEEAGFYRDEARRLTTAWTAAAADEATRAGWALARARAVARDGGRETELAWLLRVYRRHAALLPGDDYLGATVRKAEAVFRLLLPGVDEAERADLEALAADAWPADLRPALIAAVGTVLQADVLAVSTRFALRIYRTTTAIEGGSS